MDQYATGLWRPPSPPLSSALEVYSLPIQRSRSLMDITGWPGVIKPEPDRPVRPDPSSDQGPDAPQGGGPVNSRP